MSRTLKPRPTEYKGVRYRSKSEAMFAKWLEMESECGQFHGFMYEPKAFSVGDYAPDFLAWRVAQSLPVIRYFFFEYKPTLPTSTYLEHLSTKAMQIKALAFDTDTNCAGVAFSVVCGGFFSNDSVWITGRTLNGKVSFDQVYTNWLDADRRKIIASTRFDLEQ